MSPKTALASPLRLAVLALGALALVLALAACGSSGSDAAKPSGGAKPNMTTTTSIVLS